MSVDYPDFQVPQAHASAIAATGVPLLAAPSTLITAIGQAVGAAGGTLTEFATFTQVGYAIQILASYAAAPTNPFLEVTLTWTDPVAATVYDEAHYFVAGASGVSAFTTFGNGPVRSGQLEVTVTNLDPAQAATVTLQVAQDSCIRQVDRWYWRNFSDNGLSVPGFTLATLPDDEDCLGVLNGVNIAAGATTPFLFGMAPGRLVQLAGHFSGIPAANVMLEVNAVPSSAYTGSSWLLRAVPASTEFGFTFITGRSPVHLNIQNTATTGTLSMFCAMFAQD